jgi:hypothetical protein
MGFSPFYCTLFIPHCRFFSYHIPSLQRAAPKTHGQQVERLDEALEKIRTDLRDAKAERKSLKKSAKASGPTDAEYVTCLHGGAHCPPVQVPVTIQLRLHCVRYLQSGFNYALTYLVLLAALRSWSNSRRKWSD